MKQIITRNKIWGNDGDVTYFTQLDGGCPVAMKTSSASKWDLVSILDRCRTADDVYSALNDTSVFLKNKYYISDTETEGYSAIFPVNVTLGIDDSIPEQWLKKSVYLTFVGTLTGDEVVLVRLTITRNNDDNGWNVTKSEKQLMNAQGK